MTTTTVTNKEDPTTTSIELEKKTDVKTEVKPEEVQPEGEVTADAKTEEGPINAGYLHKRNTKGLIKRWTKAYFEFGGEEETPLNNFSTYFKKNKKGPTPNVATTIPENETSKAEGTATTETSKSVEPVVSTSSDAIEEVKEAKEAEDKKPEIEEAKDKVPETKETKDKVQETKDKVPEIEEAKDKKPEIEEAKDKKPEIEEAKDKKPEIEDKDKEDKKQEKESKLNNIYDNIAHAHVTGKGLLFYYRSENDANKKDANKKNPIGIINLKEYRKIEILNDQSGKQFAFKVVTSYRDFELSAESKLEQDRWIKSIKEKAEEAKTVNVKDTEKYKVAYDKIEKGTAFRSVEHGSSGDEVFSGDENLEKQKSSETKRKSLFPVLFGRKPSTTETTTTVTTTETIEDGTRKVITTTTTTETSEIPLGETEDKTGEGSPKSPHRSSMFPFFSFGKKEKEETVTSSEEIKEDKKDKEKSTEGATSAETSTAANGTETRGTEAPEESKEEKHKKGGLFEFFKKKEEITETKATEQTEQTEQTKTDSAESPADETTQQKEQKEHKDHGIFKSFFKQKQKDETPHETKEGESNEKSTEPSAEATTPQINGEEKSEAKTEEKSGETSTEKTTIFGKIFSKGKHTSENEPSEDKGESKPDDKIEESKESKELEEGKKDKQKKDKKKKEDKKEGQEKKVPGATSDSSSSSDSSSEEDKNENPLVRRVTTKFKKTFEGFRPKPSKAEEKKQEREAAANDKPEESEDKKEVVETSDVKSPEKVDSTTQIAEQTAPESSAESAETRKKFNIMNLVGRKNSSPNKRQDSTQDKGEAETAVVASASEATDVENADKSAEKEKEKEKEPENVVPEGIKNGVLHKQKKRLTHLFDQRYFVLTNDKKLCYYQSSTEPSTQKSIDLSSDSKVKKIADVGKNYHFELITKTRTYRLYADSEDDCESWIKALKECDVTVVPNEKEEQSTSGKKTEGSTRLEVPKNENETNLQQVVDNAADKAADAVDASVTETQETTTKSTNVENKEGTEGKTVTETTTTTTTITTSSSS